MNLENILCQFCCNVRGITSCPLISIGKTCKDYKQAKEDLAKEIKRALKEEEVEQVYRDLRN